MDHAPRLGAHLQPDGSTEFLVWASKAKTVDLVLTGADERRIEMQPRDRGYFFASVANAPPGTDYCFRLNGETNRPDPASQFQPGTVHAPSLVVDPNFDWHDDGWRGLPMSEYIIYELHVGTFSPEHTFDGVINRLDSLVELGVTAIELLPVAQFPGARNWGYDGVYPFAAQNSYGGPRGLKKLVDACHRRSLAVILDVVYNHLGPEGNYLNEFAHYFTDQYGTPWGSALNFDDRHSDEVRRYFIENSLQWVRDFHIDGLRLDAVHAIYDSSARPFLKELAAAVHAKAAALNRTVCVIEESNRNDPVRLLSPDVNGWGMDGAWSDDFHHSLHTLLTEEREGYYLDFGEFEQLAKAIRDGFVYDGQYSPFRKRTHGLSAAGVPREALVISTQTHDQVGNRMLGDRLSTLTSFEALKVSAALMLLSPDTPMLFMGEEYAETNPFLYFVSHGDPDLAEAVRRGRQAEFADFRWKGDVPNPQSEETFNRSNLNWDLLNEGKHRAMREFYRELIRLRKSIPALSNPSGDIEVEAWPEQRVMLSHRQSGESVVMTFFSLSDKPQTVSIDFRGKWRRLIDSADESWGGPGIASEPEVQGSAEHSLELPPMSIQSFEQMA